MKDIKFENVTTEQAAKLSELYAALKNNDIGEFSDGYHTFDELYHHRAILFSVICNTYPELAWKSKQHHDPAQPMYDGMFIVGIQTREGQATYHYDVDPYWDMFHIKELETAPEWDGHTPDEAIRRIASLRPDSLREYDPNMQNEDNNKQYVEVTLMQWEYKGHIIQAIGGNCLGLDILNSIDFETDTEFDTPSTKNDCNLTYHENEDFFTATLHDDEGNELYVEGDSAEMNQMIVAVEIIDPKSGERKLAWEC